MNRTFKAAVAAFILATGSTGSALSQPLPQGTDDLQNTLIIDTTQGQIVLKLPFVRVVAHDFEFHRWMTARNVKLLSTPAEPGGLPS